MEEARVNYLTPFKFLLRLHVNLQKTVRFANHRKPASPFCKAQGKRLFTFWILFYRQLIAEGCC
jgi:hypothetical protein